MLLRRLAAAERPQVPAFAGLGIELARVETVFARDQLSNHRDLPAAPAAQKRSWIFAEPGQPAVIAGPRSPAHPLANAEIRPYVRSMLTLLIILLIISAVFGGWGHSRWGYTGWSPLGIILVVLVILWATGNIGGGHLHRF
jgi:Protein of unknown function (DUF3309)